MTLHQDWPHLDPFGFARCQPNWGLSEVSHDLSHWQKHIWSYLDVQWPNTDYDYDHWRYHISNHTSNHFAIVMQSCKMHDCTQHHQTMQNDEELPKRQEEHTYILCCSEPHCDRTFHTCFEPPWTRVLTRVKTGLACSCVEIRASCMTSDWHFYD